MMSSSPTLYEETRNISRTLGRGSSKGPFTRIGFVLWEQPGVRVDVTSKREGIVINLTFSLFV